MSPSDLKRVLIAPSGPKKLWAQFSRDDQLWHHRNREESGHFVELHHCNLVQPRIVRIAETPEMPEVWREAPASDEPCTRQFKNSCNKSVAIYHDATVDLAFQPCLFYYVYRRWYRPYKNNIEHLTYIAQFIRLSGAESLAGDWLPPPTVRDSSSSDRSGDTAIVTVPERPDPSPAFISTVKSTHRTLCETVEKYRDKFCEEISKPTKVNGSHGSYYKWVSQDVRNHHLYVLQPLFRALAIYMSSHFYTGQDSTEIGEMSVFLIRTGEEDGLSAPISFDSIRHKIDASSAVYSSPGGNTVRTSLETAIDFVMALEARELEAFGPRPGPVATIKQQPYFREFVDPASATGTKYEELDTPSHEWVDLEKHPDWVHTAMHENKCAYYYREIDERRAFRWNHSRITREREQTNMPCQQE